MSVHRSLLSGGGLKRHRNVLTREERIKKLEEDEKWKDGTSIYGLPKVRNIKVAVKKKSKKKEEEAEGEAAAEAAPGAAAAAAEPAASGKKEEKKGSK